MRLIDLSHTLSQDIPVYPGDPKPEFVQVASIEKEGYTDIVLKTGMHVGTHIDAPFHMINGGDRLSMISLDRFVGRGVLIDAHGRPELDRDLLMGAEIRDGDIVIFETGFHLSFAEYRYYESYPEMTSKLAHELVARGVKMIGLDTPSPDRAPFAVHKILLASGVLILENLTNLQSLHEIREFQIMAFPPRLDTEGAPVRVVAITS
jgi:kynurenine formamidase